jgi:RsiW-degrading membrane proteinase PrsW (M82 family)
MTHAWASLAGSAAVALLPAIGFLVALLLLDSYQLIRPAFVLSVLGTGIVAAGVALLVNTWLLGMTGWSLTVYAHSVAPPIEETLKAIPIVFLIRRERIGFMVDAAILGFAIGSGFAIVENIDYLHLDPHASLATWLVRGFGTALMHGGATALFAATALSGLERRTTLGWVVFVPGFLLAVLLHEGFNLLSHDAIQATVGVLVGVPALLLAVFHFGEKKLRAWIGRGFDHDAELLSLLNTGALSTSPAGRYLETIKHRFNPMLRFDALCYLRLSSELSLRVKGLLMLREYELPIPPLDDATRATLVEVRHLEKTIGSTGLRALTPLLKTRGKERWQRALLESLIDEGGVDRAPAR